MDHIDRTLKDGTSVVYAWFEAMHTRIDIVLLGKTETPAYLLSLCRSVHEDVVRVEHMASCFLTDSEVSAVNASPVGVPVRLTEEMFSILERCLSYGRSTGGLFDIAVSTELTGMTLDKKVRLDRENLSAERLDERVRLNLSGFLKGYALDRALSIVRSGGVENALVSFGNSSIGAVGSHPGGRGWPVADQDGGEYMLIDECLTTSGNNTEERRHIIDPLTGRYVKGRSSVSVRTSTAEEGEVLATVTFLKRNTNN